MKMHKNNTLADTHTLDKLGIACSSLCAIHCFSITLLALFAPLIASLLETPWIHVIFLMLLIPIATLAFLRGRRQHQKNLPLCLGGIGTVFLVSPLFIEWYFAINGFDTLLTIMGSLLFILAHVFNSVSLNIYQHPGK